MPRIHYISGDASLLDRIGPLWNELNDHHREVSTYFSDDFKRTTFDVRKKALLQRVAGGNF